MIRTLHRTLSILCLSAFVSSTLSAREIYVDASATGAANGTNWADAYTNMRDAVADANGASMADNIHVSAGHYVSLSPYMITEPCTVRGHGSGAVIFESLALAAPFSESTAPTSTSLTWNSTYRRHMFMVTRVASVLTDANLRWPRCLPSWVTDVI